ncbi:sequence-specific DNA binding transcription factor [Thalictrum thalictroides]|uniref:Sequence-specific DNA binding transcription factor n=1 Tax=Thalictrum thalictroides TaxID=46969 RepID=A0A7J6VSZ0_THATH|nr:sequence-specific DNA binding transcription factor [Thalictrum thalictroides]
MESNGLQAGLLPNLTSGMLGLDMPLQPHNPQHHSNHNPNSNSHHQQYPQHHQPMVAFTSHDPQCVKQSIFPAYTTTKGKQPQQQPQLGLSDEDEPGFTADDGSGDGKKRVSPWQRVKWTDNMVRILIMAVYYIGDDFCPDAHDPPVINKKKSGAMLQKKGKWKSVSKAMMEKGFYVSPQQCEDKFNDLNKRYKRVNDILGKGTACRVVENQSLLETMDQLSPKMKDEARKLLNSKHLFFREMCAYHNSGGVGGAVGAHQTAEVAVDITHYQQQPNPRCLHSSDRGQTTDFRNRVIRGGIHEEEDEDDEIEDNEEDDDEDEDSEDEEEIQLLGEIGKCLNDHKEGHEDGNFSLKRKQRNMFSSQSSISPAIQQMSYELMSVLQDGTKSPCEQRQWMRTRSMQLEEQRVNYQFQAFELEKQQMKWFKFSSKKEREMERLKLNNERMMLESERMVLILRQKELELLDPHRQNVSKKIPDLSG